MKWEHYYNDGIILNSFKYNHKYKKFIILTCHGIIYLLYPVKNIYKNKSNYCLSYLNEITLSCVYLLKPDINITKTKFILKNASIKTRFDDIILLTEKKRLCLIFFSVLINNFSEYKNVEWNKIYFLFKIILRNITNENDKIPLLLAFYFFKILSHANIKMIVNKCNICNLKKDIITFSIISGGIICKKCAITYKLKYDKIIFIKLLIRFIKIKKYSEIVNSEFYNNIFLKYIIEKIQIYIDNNFYYDFKLNIL